MPHNSLAVEFVGKSLHFKKSTFSKVISRDQSAWPPLNNDSRWKFQTQSDFIYFIISLHQEGKNLSLILSYRMCQKPMLPHTTCSNFESVPRTTYYAFVKMLLD